MTDIQSNIISEEQEEWRPVVGYEGRYEISNFGKIKSLDGLGRWKNQRGRFLRQRMGGSRVFKSGSISLRRISANCLYPYSCRDSIHWA